MTQGEWKVKCSPLMGMRVYGKDEEIRKFDSICHIDEFYWLN
jgi:hypothetical protein